MTSVEHVFDAGSSMVPTSLPTLAQLAQRTRPLTRADEQVLPVGAPFHELLPWGGLRRGATIGAATRALGFALIAQATQAGSWAAMVGVPSAGLAAAAELGVVLDRLAVVATPPVDMAATVVAALVDAVDVVIIGTALALRPADARRLAARVRERGAVLVPVGDDAWPEGFDARFRVGRSEWVGLEQGHGALSGHLVEIEMEGRRAAARPRQAWCWLQGGPGLRWTGREDVPVDTVAADTASVDDASVAVARAG